MLGKSIYAVVFSLAAAASSASATVYNCLNCNYAAMYNMAVSKGAGSWMIFNLANGEIHKWTVTCGIPPAPPGAPTPPPGVTIGTEQVQVVCTGSEGTVTQEYRDTSSHLSSYWALTGHTMVAPFQVDAFNWQIPGYGPGHAPSAFDYVTDANLRAQLNDKLGAYGLNFAHPTAPLPHAQYLDAHWGVTINFATLAVGESLEVDFIDGSYVVVTKLVGGNVKFEHGSARDSNGRLIPDTNTVDMAGNWTFPNGGDRGNRDKLFGAMQALGIPFQGSIPTDWINLGCSWDNTHSTLTCRVAR